MKKTRQRTRKALPVSADLMVPVEPLTENQEKIFKAWDDGERYVKEECMEANAVD